MSERLHVTGHGKDRDAALADALKVAQQYFGDMSNVRGTPTDARPDQKVAGGRILTWAIDVTFVQDDPDD